MALAEGLRIQAAVIDRVALVAAAGELDLDTAPRLREALEDCLPHRPRAVEVDLGGVTFCGCEGLNVLLDARGRAVSDGIAFHVLAPGPQPCRLFQLTGTGEALGLVFPPTSMAG